MLLVEEQDAILREICSPFDFDGNNDPKEIVKQMFEIMFKENGLGLAAPQVGQTFRLFVMGPEIGEQFVCFNPEILEESDEQELAEEGCLSFPGLYFKVKRPNKIKVRYQDRDGKTHEREFEGLWARCFLHELDHLNGIVFVDKIGKVALDLANRRRKKYLRERN